MRIVANWKQFLTPDEEVTLLQRLLSQGSPFSDHVFTILPSFLSLRECAKVMNGNTGSISLGAQDISASLIEAQTGNIRADYVPVDTILIAHSEREKNNHETIAVQLKKLEVALLLNKKVILCFGEKAKVEDDAALLALLKVQLTTYREVLADNAVQQVTLAYEPHWTIGSTQTASSTIVKKVLALTQAFGFSKMLYGGSIDHSTISQVYFPALAGFLVGRASTKLETFTDLVSSLKLLV